MSNNLNLLTLSHKKITIIISFIFCIIIGSGLYGFGNDWYAAYFKSNLNWNDWYRDQLGWRISTLTIFDFQNKATVLLCYQTVLATLTVCFFGIPEVHSLPSQPSG